MTAAQLLRASQIGWGREESQRLLLVRRMKLLQRVVPPTAESRSLEIEANQEAMFSLDNSSAEFQAAIDRVTVLMGQSSDGTTGDMEKFEQTYVAANSEGWQCESHTVHFLLLDRL